MIIYTYPSSLLDIQNLTSKPSNLSSDPTQREPRACGNAQSPFALLPAVLPATTQPWCGAHADSGPDRLTQPEITATHKFTKMPLQRSREPRAGVPSTCSSCLSVSLYMAWTQDISPWTQGEKQEHCTGSRHPSTLFVYRMQKGQARRQGKERKAKEP